MKVLLFSLLLVLSLSLVRAEETVYFPKEAYSTKNLAEDLFTRYANLLKQGKQPSLWKLSQQSSCTEFRAFDVPQLLPGGFPIYRLHVNKDGSGDWIVQDLYPCYMNSKGEPLFDKPYGRPIQKTFKVSKEKIRSFLELVHKNEDFWTMPIYVDESGIADGSEAMLECVVNGKYHVVRRNGFGKGAMNRIATALLDLVKPTIKDVPELIYRGHRTKR